MQNGIHRLSFSDTIIANCVRDGRLITVVKKGPSPWVRLKKWTRDRYPDYIDGIDSFLIKSPTASPP